MPAWLLTILISSGRYFLWNVAAPAAIAALKKAGYINWAEGWAARRALALKNFVDSVETYSAPTDYPNAPAQNPAVQAWKSPAPADEAPKKEDAPTGEILGFKTYSGPDDFPSGKR